MGKDYHISRKIEQISIRNKKKSAKLLAFSFRLLALGFRLSAFGFWAWTHMAWASFFEKFAIFRFSPQKKIVRNFLKNLIFLIFFEFFSENVLKTLLRGRETTRKKYQIVFEKFTFFDKKSKKTLKKKNLQNFLKNVLTEFSCSFKRFFKEAQFIQVAAYFLIVRMSYTMSW